MTFDSIHVPDHLYFVTASICGWKPIFEADPYRRIIFGSLQWFQREEKTTLYAFAIMPSHLHAIIRPNTFTIADFLQDFGSYTAHSILKQLRQEDNVSVLHFFEEHRRDKRHIHSIWQDIQAKNIYSQEYLQQKLEYIHNNPIKKQSIWKGDRAEYPYSSACFYDRGVSPCIEVEDVRLLF